jgi:GGDEF domain-containing protein
MEEFLSLILENGKAKMSRFTVHLRSERSCAFDPTRSAEILRDWRPNLVVVADLKDLPKQITADINRSEGLEPIVLISPASRSRQGQPATRTGVTMPPPLHADRIKPVIDALLLAPLLNPKTRLPNSLVFEAHVERRIARKEQLGACFIDVDNFKSYNDHPRYGFVDGDDVIGGVGTTVTEVMQEHGGRGDLAGHIGGDEFVVLTTLDRVRPIADAICAAWDKKAPSFYNPDDQEHGYITGKNREGEDIEFWLTVSIGLLRTSVRPVSSYVELIHRLTELNKTAKARVGAEGKEEAKKHSYVFEERRSGEEKLEPPSGSASR